MIFMLAFSLSASSAMADLPGIAPSKFAYSNSVYFPAQSVTDQIQSSYYSSTPQLTSPNQGMKYLATWLDFSKGAQRVREVYMTARMDNGKPVAFPKDYYVFVTSPDNSTWLFAGYFTAQPNSGGHVAVRLGAEYLTYGALIWPVNFGSTSANQPVFQVSDVTLTRGFNVLRDLKLSPGQKLEANGFRMVYQKDGNLALYAKQSSGAFAFLWSTAQPARVCSTDCVARVSASGILTLTKSGVDYYRNSVFGTSSGSSSTSSTQSTYGGAEGGGG